MRWPIKYLVVAIVVTGLAFAVGVALIAGAPPGTMRRAAGFTLLLGAGPAGACAFALLVLARAVRALWHRPVGGVRRRPAPRARSWPAATPSAPRRLAAASR